MYNREMSTFHERRNDLISSLRGAEEQCNFAKSNTSVIPQDYGSVDRQTYRRLKGEMKKFKGKESIYKRPAADIRQCLGVKTVPDYIKNPEKWAYYTLSDVTPQQLSDETNTATALKIISEMEKRNEAETKMEVDIDDGVFKKPVYRISANIKKPLPSEVEDEKPIFKNNKVIMPEYIVGMSQKRDKKLKVKPKKSTDKTENVKKAELKLTHLFEEEE